MHIVTKQYEYKIIASDLPIIQLDAQALENGWSIGKTIIVTESVLFG